MSVGPGDTGGVLVVVFPEEQSQDGLQEERVRVDGNVNKNEARTLKWYKDHCQQVAGYKRVCTMI